MGVKLHFEIKRLYGDKWTRMSFTVANSMLDAASRGKLAALAVTHLEHYAQLEGLDANSLSVRVVDGNEVTLYYRRSTIELNRELEDSANEAFGHGHCSMGDPNNMPFA